MSDHISYISKSCFSLVRDLRRIRYALDLNTAKTIATSLVHSRLDYCNSLFLNLPSSELSRLQLILNTAARVITKTPKFHHITPILNSLHWLISPLILLFFLFHLLILIFKSTSSSARIILSLFHLLESSSGMVLTWF